MHRTAGTIVYAIISALYLALMGVMFGLYTNMTDEMWTLYALVIVLHLIGVCAIASQCTSFVSWMNTLLPFIVMAGMIGYAFMEKMFSSNVSQITSPIGSFFFFVVTIVALVNIDC